MNSHRLNQSRFLVGVVLVIVAAAMLLLTEGDSSTVGAIAIGVLGLISIAISRR
jgi:hypothetical protein